MSKLWVVCRGLWLARNKGITRLEVQLNSIVVIQNLQGGGEGSAK